MTILMSKKSSQSDTKCMVPFRDDKIVRYANTIKPIKLSPSHRAIFAGRCRKIKHIKATLKNVRLSKLLLN